MLNDLENKENSNSDNDDNNPILLQKKRKIMPPCQYCKINESKYVCPRCQYKSCSVQCVKDHKKKFYCSGQRDKFKKVNEQKDYNEKAFYRDINYLSSSISDINTSNKQVFNLLETNAIKDDDRKQTTKTLKNFKRICKKFRSITLHKCPGHLQRAKENKSHLDTTVKKIYWTVKFTFLNDPICEQLFDKTQFDDECTTLKHVIEYLNKHKDEVSNGEILTKINEEEWDSKYNVYLKINTDSLDTIDKASYYCFNKLYYKQCDPASKLKEVLHNQHIYEYPEFYFILKNA